MDKDLLRLVIIGLGLVVVFGFLTVAYIKNKPSQSRRLFNKGDRGLGSIDDSLVINTEHDAFDIVPIDVVDQPSDEWGEDLNENENTGPPAFIQLSVVASSEQGFNGFSLQKEFEVLGLIYTDLQIFQSISPKNEVRFSIACLVEPGVFPIDEMAEFFCPGVVFFMQPDEVDDPVHCFDQLVASINHIAHALDGEVRNADHGLSSSQSIQSIRRTLG
ncbi:MAG: cell division protein ZipA C-terminal FtsZ-binding domain-containing protein [Methylococcaceae bacterium]|nr:cell division protein ZipA C-terminal FtsZ-binding domain-containing protein [Methylococcaceae bacterium]